jgi:hypothetical protein
MPRFSPSKEGDQVWTEIATLYRSINHLIASFAPEDERLFRSTRFHVLASEYLSRWWIPIPEQTLTALFANLVEVGVQSGPISQLLIADPPYAVKIEDEVRQETGFSPSKEGDQVWTEIETKYRRLNDLIDSLSAEDERFFRSTRFQVLASEIPSQWWIPIPEHTSSEYLRCCLNAGVQLARTYEKEKQDLRNHFRVKPRMSERDDAVERMIDEEKRSWGEVLKIIKDNPEWRKSERGRPITGRALRAAYDRRKKAASN